MYYLSSSGLECKVKNKLTLDAKIMTQNESYVQAYVIIFALTYDSFCDVIFASNVSLFLTLHFSPDEDKEYMP